MEQKDLEYMFVFRDEESQHAAPLPPPPGKALGAGAQGRMARQPTAAAVNCGRGADPHAKPQVALCVPCRQ